MKQKKAYSSKFTTKADFSNKCNVIWDRKLQETEDKNKRDFLKMDSGKDEDRAPPAFMQKRNDKRYAFL